MRKSLCLYLLLIAPYTIYSQSESTSDELFLKARNLAFEQKDYAASIGLLKQALEKSPDYTDVSLFLGRIYTWNGDVASARAVFEELEKRGVQEEDFYNAYASLEYWNDEPEKAVSILDKGLGQHPQSETLWLLKARVYFGEDRYKESGEAVEVLLGINPKNAEGRALSVQIRELTAKNAVGITYNFSHFDKQFDDDWHIVGISYKRLTKLGSVIIRGNYANKFGEDGTQLEAEFYPRISKMFYLYIGGAYSEDVGIFAKYRTGVSLFANLPHSFEGEIGYRQLYFSDNIWMYTASVGKYYKNYWFNLRAYITPDQSNISHSYTATARYYTSGANDYIALIAGTGISPEENRNNLLENSLYKLKTFKVGAEYNFTVRKTNLFSVSAMYFNQEYLPATKGNQFDITVGYTKTF